MHKMDKKEFEALTADIPVAVMDTCVHSDPVRLYSFGSSPCYGCLDCGLESSKLSSFLGNKILDAASVPELVGFGHASLQLRLSS